MAITPLGKVRNLAKSERSLGLARTIPRTKPLLPGPATKGKFLGGFERSLGSTGLGPIGAGTPVTPEYEPPTPFDPDAYRNELTSDPMWGVAQKNFADALEMGERTLLRDPINQLTARYGYDPRAFLASNPNAAVPQAAVDLASRYLDPATLAAAQRDPASIANQIQKGFGEALAAVPGQLAMRGRLRSGASAILGNKLSYDRALQDRKALDEMLSGIGGANQRWLDFQTEQAAARRQAEEDIAARLAQQTGYNALNPATQRLIQQMRTQTTPSAWETALAGG